MKKKSYVFDLDGTLCSQEHTGTYEFAKPDWRMIDSLNILYAEGHMITIYTARGMATTNGDLQRIEKEYRPLTEKWLHDNGVMYHQLIFGKPLGDYYIDDKAINVKDWES